MKNLMDHILYQIFKITLNISLKEHERFRITFNMQDIISNFLRLKQRKYVEVLKVR